MKIRLPVFDLPAFRYRTTIGGTKYTLRFRLNTVDGIYRIDVYDRDNSTLLLGNLKLVYGLDLLAPYQHIIPGSLRVSEPLFSNGDGLDRSALSSPTGISIVHDTSV